MSSDPAGGPNAGPAGEADVGRLVGAYQQYQAQAEALAQQVGLTQITIEGMDRAIKAVDAIEASAAGQDMLVPIGGGSFIHATLTSKESIVINLGAGVSMEVPAARAKETLQARRTEVAEGAKKLSEVLAKIEGEMAKIQNVLAQMEREAAAGGHGMPGMGAEGTGSERVV